MSIVLSSETANGPITRSLSARLVVLIVGDSHEDAEQITRELESSGYTVAAQRADTPQTYAAALERGSWDIIISAGEAKALSGVTVVQMLRERDIDTPVILITDRVDEVLSLEAVAAGAEDVLKREDLYRLPYVVGRILQQAQIRQDQSAMLETGRLTLHKRGRGLGVRGLLIAIVTTLVVGVTGLCTWYVQNRSGHAHEQLTASVRELAKSSVHGVLRLGATADGQGLQSNEQLATYVAALGRDDAREIAVVDKNENIVAESFPFLVGTQFTHDPNDEVDRTLQDGVVREFTEATSGNPPLMYRLVVPIVTEAGQTIGAVVANYTVERIALDRALRSEIRDFLLVIGSTAGIGILVLAALFAARVVLPVERLRDAASKLSLGSLDVEVPKGPSNQIGDIAVGIDTLRKRLKKSLLSRQSDMVQRLRAEEALRQVHLRQKHQIEETESRAQELTQLAQMGALLHACATHDEACQIISRFLRELFPNLPSTMYLKDGATDAFKPVIAHGALATKAAAITASDCWALRRGQVHVVTSEGRELRCAHLADDSVAGSLCIPLMAQATAIGVMHIRNPRALREDLQPRVPSQALAETVAEQAALSIANLRLREELHELSISDPLTSLYNRRFAQETLNREIHRAHREQGSIGIISFDIDYFKRVNDRFGHAAGDAVLKGVAQLLQASVRGGDIACRMGGEEFAIMMPGATLAVARQRAEDVRRAVGSMQVRHSQLDMPSISMSCGVAAFPDHGITADALLRASDQALYRAKEAGRDRVESAAA